MYKSYTKKGLYPLPYPLSKKKNFLSSKIKKRARHSDRGEGCYTIAIDVYDVIIYDDIHVNKYKK